jgi:hypothetical protein
MEEPESKGPKPDYVGKLDVAAWLKKDKNGKIFLSLKIGSYVNLFKNEQRNELEIEDIFD